MLDRWIHNATKPSPQKRARQQLNALHTETLKAAQEIGKSYPNSAKSDEILRAHQHRVRRIVALRRAQPKHQAVCSVCGKPILFEGDLWTDSLPLKILYSLAIASLFYLFGWLFEWWALFIFPVGWLVSQSFLWTITVPLTLLLTIILLLSLFGM
jgi:hypothetical protein